MPRKSRGQGTVIPGLSKGRKGRPKEKRKKGKGGRENDPIEKKKN